MQTHQLFSALSDPTRLQVLDRLARSGPATATEISGEMPITRQAVAKHLTALSDVGLVERTVVGREVRFSFDPAPLQEVMEWALDVGDNWDRRLKKLRTLTEPS